MSQIVKIEMGKRLEVIIQAAHEIQEGLLLDEFKASIYQKQLNDIRQYIGLVEIDLEYLKNPNSETMPCRCWTPINGPYGEYCEKCGRQPD